jgi:hypothetical protein
MQKPNIVQYFECVYHVEIIEKYYARLEPVVYLENLQDFKKSYKLDINLYSSDEEMKKYRKEFDNLEEMNKAIDIESQPTDIKDLVIRPHYSI